MIGIRRPNLLIAVLAIIAAFQSAPVRAQTVEDLQQQLQAQEQINAQLRRRIQTLQETIDQLQQSGQVEATQPGTIPQGNEIRQAATPTENAANEADVSALEQALVQRGSSLLPAGTIQIAPGTSWDHTGSSAIHTESNVYSTSLSARMGLPGGIMVGANVPYVVHAENPHGDNSGFGDVSFSFWKELISRTRTRPSLIASATYMAPTGSDPFESAVPLGTGFHIIQGTLSTVKAVDPLVFYGNISYAHPFARTINGDKLEAGDAVGLRLGSTLAATPDVALSLGMDFAFIGKTTNNGVSITGTDRTIGLVNLGADFLLTRGTYLSLSSQVGVTDDAPDLGVSVAVPFRF